MDKCPSINYYFESDNFIFARTFFGCTYYLVSSQGVLNEHLGGSAK